MNDCAVMNESQTFWAFAHQVAAYTDDEYVSLDLLRQQFHAVHPNSTADETQAAEVRLREMLQL